MVIPLCCCPLHSLFTVGISISCCRVLRELHISHSGLFGKGDGGIDGAHGNGTKVDGRLAEG